MPKSEAGASAEARVRMLYPEGGPGRHLKERLKGGDVLIGGMVSEYARPSLTKLYQMAGFDFLFIEYEHTFFGPSDLADAVLAARDNGLPVISKVPELERAEVAKLLECGVVGIQLPRTETRDQLETLRSYMKYTPNGTRASASGFGNSDYIRPANKAQWMRDQNAETTVVVHIETRLGYENTEEIISTPGVDMVYVGPGDFSIEMGHPDDRDDPEVVRAMDEILELCKKYRVPFGTTASGPEAAGRWIEKGAQFFEVVSELTLILEGASQVVSDYRGLVK